MTQTGLSQKKKKKKKKEKKVNISALETEEVPEEVTAGVTGSTASDDSITTHLISISLLLREAHFLPDAPDSEPHSFKSSEERG